MGAIFSRTKRKGERGLLCTEKAVQREEKEWGGGTKKKTEEKKKNKFLIEAGGTFEIKSTKWKWGIQ